MMENAVKQFHQHEWNKAVAGKGGETVLKSIEQKRNASKDLMKELSRSWVTKIQNEFQTQRDSFAKKRSKDRETNVVGKHIIFFLKLMEFRIFKLN